MHGGREIYSLCRSFIFVFFSKTIDIITATVYNTYVQYKQR